MEESLPKLEHVCRMCDKNDSKMHNIFEKNDGQQLVHLVTECIPLIIYRKDPLSKHICATCYENVIKFSTFRKNTLDTFQKHKKQLELMKSPNDAVTMYLKSTTENDEVEDDEDLSDMDIEESLHNGFNYSDSNSEFNSNSIIENNLFEHPKECKKDDSENIYKQRQVLQIPPLEAVAICEALIMSKQEEFESPPHKRRRLVGPKSEMLKFESPSPSQRRIGPKSEMLRYEKKERDVRNFVASPVPTFIYQPLSLLNCTLNVVNSSIDLDHAPVECNKVETTSRKCAYCGVAVKTKSELAEHQMTHLYVVVGPRCDETVKEADAPLLIERAWSQSHQVCEDNNEATEEEGAADEEEDTEGTEASEELEDQNLLVPIEGSEVQQPEHDICILNGIPTVNGRPLAEYSKEERRSFYRNIVHNGIKRKFCNLCRYTFKDNWTIECHYFSNSCYYTCRFCGARFTKYKHMFAEHLKTHKGQEPSLKIFGQIKKQAKANPYVKRRYFHNASQPKIKPIKVKQLMMKQQLQQQPKDPSKPTIKIEPIADNSQQQRPSAGGGGGKKPYQAYFCRKCFKVFYKLDEFDVHVLACSSTESEAASYVAAKPGPKPGSHRPRRDDGPPRLKPAPPPPPQTPRTTAAEEESLLSHSGRPMRSCVREVTRYMDEPVLEPEWIEADGPKYKMKAGETGFACGICSSSFPTTHSRNSHMRIHKGVKDAAASRPPTTVPVLPQSHAIARKRPENVAKKAVQVLTVGAGSRPLSQQAPPSKANAAANPGLSNLMKLVQNNPNLTIKSMSGGGGGSGAKPAEAANRQQSRPSTSHSHSNAAPAAPVPAPRLQPAQPNSRKKPGPKPRSALPPIPPPLILNSAPEQTSDPKNYRCQGCHKPFANKSNLYFHKKNYCTGSRFPCPLCKKRFGSEEAYNSHLYYSHPE